MQKKITIVIALVVVAGVVWLWTAGFFSASKAFSPNLENGKEVQSGGETNYSYDIYGSNNSVDNTSPVIESTTGKGVRGSNPYVDGGGDGTSNGVY